MYTKNNGIMPLRPEPIIADIEAVSITSENIDYAIDEIFNNNFIIIDDFYSTGLKILSDLKIYLKSKYSEEDFQQQRIFRNAYHNYSKKILLEVENNKLIVKKSPEIGWLKILYPDVADFVLTFSDVQGLNSSWQWYQKGILIPTINKKIYPYYKTYFPTRFEHLELFEEWLKKYSGEKKSVYDIGSGSGILTFMLLNYNFSKIFATDNNPNAIIGLSDEIQKNQLSDKINYQMGDLFADFDLKSELIVFNPPWLPAQFDLSGIDSAIYYQKSLFPRFFDQAYNHLTENGKIAIIFSNLAQITEVCKTNPIEEELKLNQRFKLDFFDTKKIGAASKQTKRNQSWRNKELVELWVLSLR